MRVNPALDEVGAHPITSIQQRVRDLRRSGEEVIDFSLGDPVEPTWDAIPRAVREAVPAVSQYPTTRGLDELRKAVAGYLERRFGVRVDPDTQVIPTSGAKEAIFSSALAFVDRSRGDVVGYPDPAYPVYERGAVMAGAAARAIATDERFVLGVDSVPPEFWDQIAMLWICTPSNPTGAVTPRADLEDLVETARSHDVLLCSDECYVDLYEEGMARPSSVLEVTGGDARGVLAFHSLSKRSGMTGYRSGAVIGDAEAIDRLYRLRTSTGTASAELIQRGAVTAWSDDDHVAHRRQVFGAKRKMLREGLEAMGLRVAASEAGLYLWVEVGGDDVEVSEQLVEVGIVVSPGSIFGSRGSGFLRLALVPDLETCSQSLAIMAPLLQRSNGAGG